MQTLKPKPKFGWYGHTSNPCAGPMETYTTIDGDEIGVGSRVFHISDVDTRHNDGIIVSGPHVRRQGTATEYLIFKVVWDAYPNMTASHTCESLRKAF